MPRSKANLTGQALAIERSRELKEDMTHLEAIRRHFYDPRIILSEHEQKVLERLSSMWYNGCKGYPTKSLVEIHQKTFKMGYWAAFQDWKHCKELFGDPKLVNKAADAAMAAEMALQLYRDALENSDFKGAAAALTNFIKARGLDKDDGGAPPFEKIEIKPDEIVIPKQYLEALMTMIKSSPVLDLSKMLQKNAEDVEYANSTEEE